MNIIVDESDECIVDNVDKDLVLEAALAEPSTGTTATIIAMEPNHYNHFTSNHDQFNGEQDYELAYHPHHSVQNIPELYHQHQAMFNPNLDEVFSSNNHHLIYAHHQRFQQRGMGAFV